MNDFERKLSQQPFRQPPAELRAALFPSPENVIVPPSWTWRDWLWPSPQAWAALAALWLLFAMIDISRPSISSPVTAELSPAPPTAILVAHRNRDFRHVLDLAN